MIAFQKIKKDKATELAWKELKEALKPLGASSSSRSVSGRRTVLKHPAIVTISEFSRWELFV